MVLFQFYSKVSLVTKKQALAPFNIFWVTYYAARIKKFEEIMKPSSIVMLQLRFTTLQLCKACFFGNTLFSPPTQCSPIQNLFL